MLVEQTIFHNHEVSYCLSLQHLLWEYLSVEKQMIIWIIEMLPLLGSALDLLIKSCLSSISCRLDLTLVQIEQYLSWYLSSHCIMQQSIMEPILSFQVGMSLIKWN